MVAVSIAYYKKEPTGMTDPGGKTVQRTFRERHRWTLRSVILCVLIMAGIYSVWDGAIPANLAMVGYRFALLRIVIWIMIWFVFFDKITYRLIARWADVRTADVVRAERIKILLWILSSELMLLFIAFMSRPVFDNEI